MKSSLAACCFILALVTVGGTSPGASMQQPTGHRAQSHRNLGKAYYERGQYAQAAEEFLEALKLEDGTARDHFNAGMALLQSADYDRALGAFTTARQIDPELAGVDFGLGTLHKRLQRYPDALRALQAVAGVDPDDPCTWFNIGAVYFSMNRFHQAADAFQRVLDMGFSTAQNFYVSALFRQATLLSRQNQVEEAKKLFSEFQPLRERVPSVSLTPSALENGRHAQIIVPVPVEERPSATAVTPVYSPLGTLRFAETSCEQPPAVSLGDYDRDGRVDLFISNPCGSSRLFHNDGGGTFSDVTTAVGLGEPGAAVGGAFLDYENEGFPSLLILNSKATRLYVNRDGQFTDASARSGLSQETATTGASAVVFDFDNDGQLDLFLTGLAERAGGGSGVGLYRNAGDGSFRDVSSYSSGVGLRVPSGSDWRAADFADFDNDGFADLLLVSRGSSALLLRNLGGERFFGTPVALGGRTRGGTAPRIQIGDFDNDGWFDALVSGEGGYTVLRNDNGGRLEPMPELPDITPHDRGAAVAMDADANGWSDFLFQGASGSLHRVASSRGLRVETAPLRFPDTSPGYIVTADLDGRGNSDVILAGADGVARIFRHTSPARPAWLSLDLKGDKSNRQGVGAVLEVKAGNFYRKLSSRGLPLLIYTAGRERLDVIRVTWSNGVIQNEVEVGANQRLEVVESDRQTSSCPFVYIWDGKAFRFLTDVVGRAPLGERLPDGSLLQPNPEDYVRIPPDSMKLRNGQYVFQLTEELREVAYLDAVELLVIDHPAGTELYTDERFSAPPFEGFRLYAVSDRRLPLRATNHRGENLLDTVSQPDGVYAYGRRERIPGIAEQHALVVDPGDLSDAKTVRLFLSGWVFWANSSAMRALSTNSHVPFQPPVLQVKDRKGQWVTVVEDLGLPSGINRTLVADLTGKFLSNDFTVRVLTNLSVYWDHAFFSTTEDDGPVRIQRLGPTTADLHYRGFSKPVRKRYGSTPDFFDYSQILEEAPWNAAAGRYTEYGKALALLDSADNQMMVMAPGDEATVSFDPTRLESVRKGWRRDFVLHLTGWAKDNEPTTVFFDRVDPLPYLGMSGYADGAWKRAPMERRTRRVPSLIPRLSPYFQ